MRANPAASLPTDNETTSQSSSNVDDEEDSATDLYINDPAWTTYENTRSRKPVNVSAQ